ncbi:histidine kinase [Methyloligella sp. 2.7D]|nr:histidine kinase [Methyloligella sp. GL2]QKP76584.1 histidine kinase [Methyloligella sp. GL2]
MPTLFRLITVLALIVGTVAGSLYVLAEYFQPVPKEITKSLRNVEVRKE